MSRARWIVFALAVSTLALTLALVGCENGTRSAQTVHDASPTPGTVTETFADAPEFDLGSVLRSEQSPGPAGRGRSDWPAISFRRGASSGAASAGQRSNTPMMLASVASTDLSRDTRELTFPDASPTDELWIICEPETARAQSGDDLPGTGALMTRLAGQTEPVPVPLEHTDVTGSIAGFVASVNVKQKFHNPYDEKIEALYVFPLPQNAAVNGFVMTIGERQIRGIIRKRAEAEQLYAAARARGHVASLLTQERANIFTQKVANIEPGKRIDVDITYFNTLGYSDGWYEFVFPMVVGPRFNPPWLAGQGGGIGTATRGAPGASGQAVEVQYLAPNERSGHDISLELAIEAGVEIEDVRSTSHRFKMLEESGSRVRVQLAGDDTIPNKDFVLRYRVAGDAVKPGLLVQPDEDGAGGHFAMTLTPPADLSGLPQGPLELVFVLDCSGSMNGRPIEQAKAAVSRALDRLRPTDSFQIIRFSNNASALGRAPLDATPENIAKGRKYLSGLHGGGGTMMIEGIKAALDFPHDPERLRFVAFLTDGFIGNDDQILHEMGARLGDSRVFSFGVGSAPNRYLMDRMARVGRGAAAYVGLNHDAGPVMDLFLDRVERAALTDIALDFGDLNVAEVYPRRVPDLFVGRPVVVLGRYEGRADERDWSGVRVNGRAGGEARGFAVGEPADVGALAGGSLGTVWARMKIADIVAASVASGADARREELALEVERVALAHGLMSAFTAFVAVDSSRVTEGGHGTTVAVPVPVPEGVRYETTVGSGG